MLPRDSQVKCFQGTLQGTDLFCYIFLHYGKWTWVKQKGIFSICFESDFVQCLKNSSILGHFWILTSLARQPGKWAPSWLEKKKNGNANPPNSNFHPNLLPRATQTAQCLPLPISSEQNWDGGSRPRHAIQDLLDLKRGDQKILTSDLVGGSHKHSTPSKKLQIRTSTAREKCEREWGLPTLLFHIPSQFCSWILQFFKSAIF